MDKFLLICDIRLSAFTAYLQMLLTCVGILSWWSNVSPKSRTSQLGSVLAFSNNNNLKLVRGKYQYKYIQMRHNALPIIACKIESAGTKTGNTGTPRNAGTPRNPEFYGVFVLQTRCSGVLRCCWFYWVDADWVSFNVARCLTLLLFKWMQL